MLRSHESDTFAAPVDLLLSLTTADNRIARPSLNIAKQNVVTQPRDNRRHRCDWDVGLAICGGCGAHPSHPLLQAELLLGMQHYHMFLEVEKEPHHTRSVFPESCWIADWISHHELFTVDGHGSPRLRTQQGGFSETPRAGAYLFETFIQDGRMPSQISLHSPTPPPELYARGPQHPEMTTSNLLVSVRGSATPSAVSNNCAPSFGAPGVVDSYPSPRKFLIPLGRKESNLSEDVSIITLPSFVEHESRNSIPPPMLTPPDLSVIEGARPPSSSRRSSPLSLPSRSRNRATSTTRPTAPPWETHFRHDFPSSSLLVPDRQSHPPHQTLSRWAQAEALRVVQSGTMENSRHPRTNRLRPGALSPLKIPGHTSSGGYDPLSTGDQLPSYKKRGARPVSRDPLRLVPPQPSPRETPRGPVELEDTPPALFMKDATKPSPYRSPALGFSNSPSSYSSSEERRAHSVSQARSSTSTILSISAFPSPPDFTPGPGANTLFTVKSYSTSGRPSSSATLWKNDPVRGVEIASPNGGQASTPLPDANTRQPMSIVDSRPVLNRDPHPVFIGKDYMPVRSGVPSRVSSMRRLSRMPLGPRQMPDGPTSLRRWAQPLSV